MDADPLPPIVRDSLSELLDAFETAPTGCSCCCFDKDLEEPIDDPCPECRAVQLVLQRLAARVQQETRRSTLAEAREQVITINSRHCFFRGYDTTPTVRDYMQWLEAELRARPASSGAQEP